MQNKKTHKPPKNKLLKNNIINRRKNKPPLEGIGNHLICLNKILRYPFLKDKAIYCIQIENLVVLELIENLKVFGFESLYDSETKLLEISLLPKKVNYAEIRCHKYYGYISPLPKILELRENFDDNFSSDDENVKKFHLDCIKKVLKCESSKIINYYIPDFGLLENLLETLKEYQYSIKFDKNILTITL